MEQYFEKLKQLFIENNFDEKTYSQIIEKYELWYAKLINDGKTDAEVQEILKSPEEVTEVFVAKFGGQKADANVTAEVYTSDSVVQQPNFVKEEYVPTEQYNPQTNQQRVDPNLITKTTKSGKTLYYNKRSFGGAFGMFFIFFLVSLIILPLLTIAFSATLTISFFSLLVFFAPVMYLGFINNFEAIAYLQPADAGIIRNTADRVLTLPYEFINHYIELINQMTAFDWNVFLTTLMLSLFAFALLLISLFLTLQIFKGFINYFSYYFNKIALKRIRN